MGDVVPIRSSRKRVRPDPIPIEDDRLVEAVERRISEERGRGGWRLSKRRPRDRHDLIVLARNLATMRDALPHGERSRVLLRAGFAGADEANVGTYVNNLTLPSTRGAPSADRLRRLSSKVQRYVAVAEAIEGDRGRALARLFRGTSFDRDFSDDWQGRMAARLDRMVREVAAEAGLSRYFDEASAANVHLVEDEPPRLCVTGWMSETFHKTEFAEARAGCDHGAWLYDRQEEGVPRGGAPLFVPLVPLDVRRRVWTVERAGGSGGASCVFVVTLHVAIVPIAASLTEPCRVECWLIERPTVGIGSVGTPVWQVVVDDNAIAIRAGEDVFRPVDKPGFRSWSMTEQGRLLVEQADGPPRQSDLLNGGWWCAPATAGVIAGHLSRSRSGGVPLEPVDRRRLEAVVEDPLDLEEADLHAAVPEAFPPHGTLALEMAYGLADLQRRLRSAAEERVWAFREFLQRVRSASPLHD